MLRIEAIKKLGMNGMTLFLFFLFIIKCFLYKDNKNCIKCHECSHMKLSNLCLFQL